MIGVFLFPEKARPAPKRIQILSTESPKQIISDSSIVTSVAPLAIVTKTTKLLFMGDMMFDRQVAVRMRLAKTFFYPFEKICQIKNCFFDDWDFTIANLEGPITAKRLPPVKEIDFVFDPKIIPILKQVGLDAVSLANNHALDQGRIGFLETHQSLKSAGIPFFGDEMMDDSFASTAILEKNNRRFALIGFNITDNLLDEKAAKESVEKAAAMADFTIIFIHWGQEYQAKPKASQVSLAHKLLDWGADAIIGSHSHWMQSVEIYDGKPVIYSLGNFIFDQDWSAETNYGLMVGLTFDDSLDQVEILPVKIDKSQPTLLIGSKRQARLDRLAEISDKKLAEQIKSGVMKF